MGFLASIFGGGSQIQTPTSSQQATDLFNQQQMDVTQQQKFVNALMGQNAIGNQQNVFNQLQGVANGQGPNPAQALLNQATGQNVQNQAALAASQRGVGANAGLLARQAAQEGGNLQQQAVGQGAALQAQQSLGALGQLGGLAGQQVAQQQQGLGQLNQIGLQGQQNVLNAIGGQNQAAAGITNGAGSNILSGVGGALAKAIGGQNKAAAGNGAGSNILSDVGGAATMLLADGGSVPGPKSFVAQHLMSGGGKIYMGRGTADNQSMALDGESYAHSHNKVPGHPQVAGDSQKNDTVPAMLSPGEIIVPRSHANDPEKAAKFAAAVAAKNRKYALGGAVKK